MTRDETVAGQGDTPVLALLHRLTVMRRQQPRCVGTAGRYFTDSNETPEASDGLDVQ